MDTLNLKTGDLVVIDYPDSQHHGKVGIYKYSAPDGESHNVYFEAENAQVYFQTRFIKRKYEALPEMTPDEMIADLTEQLYQTCKLYDDTRARLSASQNYYRNDMGHFERTMRDQKEKHGWCDEGANAVIDALVEGFIGGWEIERYEDEHEVEVEINCEGLVVQHTVSLMATSQEEANDRVLEDPDAYFDPAQVIRDYLDYGYPDIRVELA